jgi:hypothetical protein
MSHVSGSDHITEAARFPVYDESRSLGLGRLSTQPSVSFTPSDEDFLVRHHLEGFADQAA